MSKISLKSGIVFKVLNRTVTVYLSVLRAFPGYSIFMVICTIITGFMPIISLWIMKLLTDAIVTYLSTPSESRLFKPVLHVLGLYILVNMITSIVTRANSHITLKLSRRYGLKIQEDVYVYCSSMDYQFYESPELRDTLYRTQTQSAGAANAMIFNAFDLSRRCITIVGSAVAVYLFSPTLLVVALSLMVLNAPLNMRLGKQQYEMIKQRTERVRKANYLRGLLVQRHHARDNILFGTWKYFIDYWKTLEAKTLVEDIKYQFKRLMIGSFTEAVARFSQCGAYIYVIWATGIQNGTVGTVFMNVGLFNRAQDEINRISNTLVELYRNTIFLDDYYDLRKIESIIEKKKGGLEAPRQIRSIEFENVAFQYPNSKRYAISDASFNIKAGECVCFVGGNGAGKSTLIKLMLRLFDPLSGRILINGHDFRDYAIKEIRRLFGVLMQDFSYYLLSFKENVILGNLEKADQKESFWKAVNCAGLWEMVESLPKKEDTILGKIFGDGEDLSIGEWQKLGLARIFFRDAGIFVLDEPTSALDAKTEEMILEQFRKKTRGKISIIVSHRFSSARIADKIIVVDKGRIEEIGTHVELMERNGLYKKLFNIQRKRYVGDEADSVEASLNTSLYEAQEASDSWEC